MGQVNVTFELTSGRRQRAVFDGTYESIQEHIDGLIEHGKTIIAKNPVERGTMYLNSVHVQSIYVEEIIDSE